MKYVSIFFMFLILILSGVVGYRMGRGNAIPFEVHDTITTIDTITIDKPFPVYREVVEMDTFQLLDTIRINDTIYTLLPRERKVYEDSLFRAVISGVRPSLDSMKVFTKTKVITLSQEAKVPKFGLGAQLGITFNGKAQPYIGIGVQYNFICW